NVAVEPPPEPCVELLCTVHVGHGYERDLELHVGSRGTGVILLLLNADGCLIHVILLLLVISEPRVGPLTGCLQVYCRTISMPRSQPTWDHRKSTSSRARHPTLLISANCPALACTFAWRSYAKRRFRQTVLFPRQRASRRERR